MIKQASPKEHILSTSPTKAGTNIKDQRRVRRTTKRSDPHVCLHNKTYTRTVKPPDYDLHTNGKHFLKEIISWHFPHFVTNMENKSRLQLFTFSPTLHLSSIWYQQNNLELN